MGDTLSRHTRVQGSAVVEEARGAGLHVLAQGTFNFLDADSEGDLQPMATVGVASLRACVPVAVLFRPLALSGTLAPAVANVVVVDGMAALVGNVIPNTSIKAFTLLSDAFMVPASGKFSCPALPNYGLAFRLATASTSGTTYTVEVTVMGFLL